MAGEGIVQDLFGIVETLPSPFQDVHYVSLEGLGEKLGWDVGEMPVTLRILLESTLRHVDGELITREDVEKFASWSSSEREEIPFMPSRVLMQDFTGVPALVDLAVMRDALSDLGGDPERINPLIPVDLIIDHSVQVDKYATINALPFNAEMEFTRNRERYEFLRWGAGSFDNLRVVPPATGICHQVNLEYLARVVQKRERGGALFAYPDTLVGTDSHTPMIDGIGVLGWGVGGIEAEAVILGQPYYMLIPEVIGLRLTGSLPPGAMPTDIVLRITELLRKYGVVGKLVEMFGPGVASMTVADRALVSNMSPEMGATAVYFPVDDQTLAYLRATGRPSELVDLVETYTRQQGLFREGTSGERGAKGRGSTERGSTEPRFTDVLELDLTTIVPSVAGPKRPQDRIPLAKVNGSVPAALKSAGRSAKTVRLTLDGRDIELKDGDVVISAITSCTNTSNPTVMIGAGILARKAVQRGLRVPPHVKTSLAPGSRVVTRYLEETELMPYLEALGYHLVGYGCTTCIGNSGPLRKEISGAIREEGLVVASVLSGNRNFEGRIHPDVKASYLMSPPLVVAFGIAGTMNINLQQDPIGRDRNGDEVFLSDIWPRAEEIARAVSESLSDVLFTEEYGSVYAGNDTWNEVAISKQKMYRWTDESTYIRKPPFFDGMNADIPPLHPIENARVLALLGETVTTDHISPAGSIPTESPAGRWLVERGVRPEDFNSYGSRRGNHEVMMRGTFGNIRIRNFLVPDAEGGVTKLLPDGKVMPIFDAATEYAQRSVPLLVIAGAEYGAGSSRDWAAKGTALLGVRAVLAQSFERIHRSNLIGMGILPLQFQKGESARSLGLTGMESYSLKPPSGPGQLLTVSAGGDHGKGAKQFSVLARIDTPVEFEYFRNGGILHTVLRQMSGKPG